MSQRQSRGRKRCVSAGHERLMQSARLWRGVANRALHFGGSRVSRPSWPMGSLRGISFSLARDSTGRKLKGNMFHSPAGPSGGGRASHRSRHGRRGGRAIRSGSSFSELPCRSSVRSFRPSAGCAARNFHRPRPALGPVARRARSASSERRGQRRIPTRRGRFGGIATTSAAMPNARSESDT